jgi:hypothetical protein
VAAHCHPLWVKDPWASSGSETGPSSGDQQLPQHLPRASSTLADDTMQFGAAGPDQCDGARSETAIQNLVDDRMMCIRPVVLAELRRALGMGTTMPSQEAILRRNVGAHPRGRAAGQKISELNVHALKSAQRSGSTSPRRRHQRRPPSQKQSRNQMSHLT